MLPIRSYSDEQIIIINGPNLNLLGKRELDIYGSKSFEVYFQELLIKYPDLPLQYLQSNHEGFIIDYLHQFGFDAKGIVLNAGAYTHTSIAIADAIKAIETPVIEVHISDINQREEFRKHSYLTAVCHHHIIGKGLAGYDLAIQHLLEH